MISLACWERVVRDSADISFIGRRLAAEANTIGFDEEATGAISIAMTELATNILQHGTKNGRILVRELDEGNSRGLEIVAFDDGPGIANINTALVDNYSSLNSMGCGLGAVQRLMDDFSIYSTPESYVPDGIRDPSPCGGTIVLARKWVSPQQKLLLSWGGASRPHPGFQANGDALLIRELDDRLVVVVIDALGHGEEAEVVSQTAIKYITANIELSPLQLIADLHVKLKGLRGAVVTIGSLNLVTRVFSWVGVGNIEMRIIPTPRLQPIPKPGIVGYGRLPELKLIEIPLPETFTLVMFSDGIKNRFSLNFRPELMQLHPAMISHLLLREYARDNDDATALVVKGSLGT